MHFFYKQPVYKQPTLGSQIAKQLSGLNLFSLSNNKVEFFLCNKRKIAVKPTINQNLAVSKALFRKF